jgi:DNA uptake protein ComE-like DNA-binding protein
MKRLLTAAGLCLLAACADRTEETAVPEDTLPPPTMDVGAPAEMAMISPEGATRDELLQVPNINASLADALIAARPFDTMLEVDSILAPTLSPEQRADVYRTLWKPMDLNTASREEILLIPDVDPRMPHEFDEYRPYTDMEQFRREIGKYVDTSEVTRYEKYVELRN